MVLAIIRMGWGLPFAWGRPNRIAWAARVNSEGGLRRKPISTARRCRLCLFGRRPRLVPFSHMGEVAPYAVYKTNAARLWDESLRLLGEVYVPARGSMDANSTAFDETSESHAARSSCELVMTPHSDLRSMRGTPQRPKTTFRQCWSSGSP